MSTCMMALVNFAYKYKNMRGIKISGLYLIAKLENIVNVFRS